MEHIHTFKSQHSKLLISHQSNTIFLYTPLTGHISIYTLQTLTILFEMHIDPFLTLNCTTSTFLITTTTHIIGYSNFTGQKNFFLASNGCSTAYLLPNNRLIFCYTNYLILYNQYNQEEYRYNFELYHLTIDALIIYIAGKVTVFEYDFSIREEKILPYKVYENLTFSLYKKRLVYLNGSKITGPNFIYTVPMNVLGFKMTEAHLFLNVKNGFLLVDRKENVNINLKISAGIVKKYLNPSNKIVECESVEIFEKYCVLKRSGDVKVYKEIGVSDMYIEGDKTYDYVEAECEFDVSEE